MDTEKSEIRKKLGAYFIITGKADFLDKQDEVYYVIFPKVTGTGGLPALKKFIRMFAFSYRMVLIAEDDREYIGFVLIGRSDDKEELDSTINWIAKSHPEWIVSNLQEKGNGPNIIGCRIANNPFHARKLRLQLRKRIRYLGKNTRN